MVSCALCCIRFHFVAIAPQNADHTPILQLYLVVPPGENVRAVTATKIYGKPRG
jgi:hypothetical protein